MVSVTGKLGWEGGGEGNNTPSAEICLWFTFGLLNTFVKIYCIFQVYNIVIDTYMPYKVITMVRPAPKHHCAKMSILLTFYFLCCTPHPCGLVIL